MIVRPQAQRAIKDLTLFPKYAILQAPSHLSQASLTDILFLNGLATLQLSLQASGRILQPGRLVWQLPIIGLGTHLLVVVLLLLFGYEIATPLLSIRPASKTVINTAEVKAVELQTDIPRINWERPKEIVGQVSSHVLDN